jgi:serine/threonine protein phosphatase 1
VIGDIHGRLDLLDTLVTRLAGELNPGHAQGRARLLFLGDYIDRGPSSAGVLARLREIEELYPDTVFLRGNHEQVMLDLLSPPKDVDPQHTHRMMQDWLRYGGQETLASYGVSARLIYANETAYLLEALRAAVQPKDIAFLQKTALKAESGDYFFAHAGVHPEKALDAQNAQDLLWIREPFLSHSKPLERVVVHGHSISPHVCFHPHRIGIDTGAYKSGCLTALVLRGYEQRLVQTANL